MIIDIIFALLMVMAVVKGYRRGFIVAVFSIIALIAGLAAAIKFSALAAVWLKDAVTVSAKWLPVLSFALVFIIAVLLVRLGATIIEKTVEFAMLGWLNRLAGILLFSILYILIFSVILFYSEKANLLSKEAIASSRTAEFIRPIAPLVIEQIGSIFPLFKNMFHDLETFFANIQARTN